MKMYSCDRCVKQIESTDAERREWTAITLSKIEGSASFQNADLCPACTAELRLFLQGAKTERA